MKKRFIIVAAIIGVMLCACGTNEPANTTSNEEIKKLQEQVAKLEQQTTAPVNEELTTAIEDLKTTVATLEGKVTALEGQAGNTNAGSSDVDIKALKDEIATLKNKVSTLEGKANTSTVNTISEAELKGMWKYQFHGEWYEVDLSTATLKGNFIVLDNGKCIYYQYIDGKLYASEHVLEKK